MTLATLGTIRPLTLQEQIDRLIPYFESRDDVLMAFVFGSRVSGRAQEESDLDIGVYFTPQRPGALEFESGVKYPQEIEVWHGASDATHDEVDLVVLNNVSGMIASAAVDGIPLVIKDDDLFVRYAISADVVFRGNAAFVHGYYKMSTRTRTLAKMKGYPVLTEHDKSRLETALTYLGQRLLHVSRYDEVDKETYLEDWHERDAIEKWVENLVNASLDVARSLLVSRGQTIPPTYGDTFRRLGALDDFERDDAERLGRFARLRNILAHEYFDTRYNDISELREACKDGLYERLIEFAKRRMDDLKPTD
ncbi:MAG: DUF86 domain-containing protein [Candidatus Poribacteria bacterium]|nr:DUF86 domain-containing protein [Candidatus Poribacteria bacterium]